MSKGRKCHDAAVATIVLLAERFPNCFRLHDPGRPLKTGIHHDIHLALEGAITPRELGSALRRYCSSPGYLARMLEGASRIGLDGQVAGAVTGEEAQHARDKLAGIKAKRARTVAAAPVMKPKGTKPSGRAIMGRPDKGGPTPDPSAPKRLSLDDLREAARRRREQQGTAACAAPSARASA